MASKQPLVLRAIGAEGTTELKSAGLDPEWNNPDKIINAIFLCHNRHALLDGPLVSLIPQILESPASVFSYDPRTVDHQDAVFEFPDGLQHAVLSILKDDSEVPLRTTDPLNLPLPHPLLNQLKAICSRMVVTPVYPVLTNDDIDGDTVWQEGRVP